MENTGLRRMDVRQLVGHLAGAPKDIFTGRVGDIPPNEWTARQVSEREQLTLDEVLSTWDSEAAEWVTRIDSEERFGPILVIDLFTHEHDVRAAIGAPAASEPEAEDAADFVVQTVTGWLDQTLRSKELPALRVRAASEAEWVLGSGEPAATVTLPSKFELARALTGRRSRRQLEGYDWDPAPPPAELVEAVPQLPMAREDQPL
jgi:uncharacterized protein (TIGR03083 family)